MTAAAPLRILVVDDEPPARDHLLRLLAGIPATEVVDIADSGPAAVAAIHRHAPELVLLDVQMPGMTGFDVIRAIGTERMPATIFVTAYDHYALTAFEVAAVDYLLKPFDDDRFECAIERARQLHQLRRTGELAARLRQALALVGLDAAPGAAAPPPDPQWLDRIAVELRGQLRVVLVGQIDYISASGVYAELHVGDRTHVVRERMQMLETRLDPRRFFRTHRSAIVQLDRIEALLRQAGGDYTLRLKTGALLPVSRNRVEQLERWMGVTRPTPAA